MYPSDLIDKVLKSVDIVNLISSYIHVEAKGRNYWALCPFHDDKHASLSISREKQIFKCFSCNTSGNAITFVQKYEKISFDDAVKKVAAFSGYSDPRLLRDYTKKRDPAKEPFYQCLKDLTEYYSYALLTSEGKAANEYLLNRGLTPEDIEHFKIGYSPTDGAKTIDYLKQKGHSLHTLDSVGILSNSSGINTDKNAGRVIFPILNPDGDVVGFSARKLTKNDDSPKYVNTPETVIFHKGENLYHYNEIKETARRDGYVYIFEGFMDMIAAYKAGFTSSVALMGTNLTDSQIKLLRFLQTEIRLSLDPDQAGITGMMKIINQLTKARLNFRLVKVNPSETRDLDEILKDEGKEGVSKFLNNLVDGFTFQLDYYQSSNKSWTEKDKENLVNHFLPYIASLNGLEKENALVRLSKITSYEVEVLRNAAKNVNFEIPKGVKDEEIVFVKSKTNKDERATKLKYAEKQLLHYMIKNTHAIEFYEQNIQCFYDEAYQKIASYLEEYVAKRPGEDIDLSLLLNDISLITGDAAKDIQDLAIELDNESIYPEQSDKELNNLAKVIKEEKRKIEEKRKRDEDLKKGQDQGAVLKAYVEKRKAIKKKG